MLLHFAGSHGPRHKRDHRHHETCLYTNSDGSIELQQQKRERNCEVEDSDRKESEEACVYNKIIISSLGSSSQLTDVDGLAA